MELIRNPLFLSAFLAMIIAQVLKVLLIFVLEKRAAWHRVTETGGMPSSHSATVAGLSTAAGLELGLGHPLFAACLVFSGIIIYDATGIRRAAGKHAEILNELMKEFTHVFEPDKYPEALKTLLGHTWTQVGAGVFLGIVCGIVISALPL